MMVKKIKKNRGFVVLFAVTISSILLAIALGVASIAVNEVKFGTSVRDTNDAFFAADSGIEQALFNDKEGDYTPVVGQVTTFSPLVVLNLGSSDKGCANVSITKDAIGDGILTEIVSKGYSRNGSNIEGVCMPAENSVERELGASY